MDKQELREVVLEQHANEMLQEYVPRQILEKIDSLHELQEVIVITGMRRAGKSTVLERLRHLSKEQDYFINFEDERLVGFTIDDGQRLLEVFMELWGPQHTLFLDEIQEVPQWERWVRRLYGQGYKIYLTGSNASLFSKDLGTLLTGRYVQVDVYPYSFAEYAGHHLIGYRSIDHLVGKERSVMLKLFSNYLAFGGIPVVSKTHSLDYLQSLYTSILYRDIIARYKLRDDRPIKELVLYLASHVGKEQSFSGLKKTLGLGSATTVADYCYYLENSYLCFTVNRYSHSVKAQMLSGKKFYFVDHALTKFLGFHFSADRGRLLENIVFVELKRRNFEVYYHKGQKECDFIVRFGAAIIMAIQVTVSMAQPKTREREIAGLIEAMELYSLKTGLIITEEAPEIINIDEKKIIVISLWQWLLKSADVNYLY